MTTPKEKKFDFEKALARISEISVQIELEEIGLQKSVELYKEAAELKNLCDKFLKSTQTIIQEVNKSIEFE